MESRCRDGKVTIEWCGDGRAERGMSKARRRTGRSMVCVVTNGETCGSLGTGEAVARERAGCLLIACCRWAGWLAGWQLDGLGPGDQGGRARESHTVRAAGTHLSLGSSRT